MSELKVLKGGAATSLEVLAAGTMFISERNHEMTFDYGSETVVVRPLLEVPPKGPNGHFLLPLPEGALMPGADALHKLGDASVYVQMRKLARHPSYIGPDEFLFIYEVTRRASVPHLRSVA